VMIDVLFDNQEICSHLPLATGILLSSLWKIWPNSICIPSRYSGCGYLLYR
jgi:hypothetical protein